MSECGFHQQLKRHLEFNSHSEHDLTIFFRCIASGHLRNSSFKERTAVITQLTYNVTLPLEILAPLAM
jgi:hypothetical protein